MVLVQNSIHHGALPGTESKLRRAVDGSAGPAWSAGARAAHRERREREVGDGTEDFFFFLLVNRYGRCVTSGMLRCAGREENEREGTERKTFLFFSCS